MSFLLASAALCASGWGLLRLLRLSEGRWAVDVPLGWLAGTGWLAFGAFVLRFLADVPYRAATAAGVLLAPLAVLGVREALARRRRPAASEVPAETTAVPSADAPRWIPRPTWLFAVLAVYVAVTTAAVVLHGVNTPTNTDDAMRVRAFAPMLALADAWSPSARHVLVYTGPLPAFVPSLAWRMTGTVDHFHVNYAVLAAFLALLALAVALSAARGRPEWGWASAFAVTSLPLFAYHLTSTYSDAVLATYLGAAFLFLLEHGRRGDGKDARRAMLLIVVAALVKREGELVAAPVAAVLLAQVACTGWRDARERERRGPETGSKRGREKGGSKQDWSTGWKGAWTGAWSAVRPLALLAAPYLLVLAARVRLAGAAGAFPFLQLAVEKAAASADPRAAAAFAVAQATPARALPVFLDALFRSGNAGLVWWVLPAAAVLLAPALRRRGLAWALAAVALLLAEAAVSAIWVFPEFTLDQGTVHRALLPVSVAAALWVAAAVTRGDPPVSAEARTPTRRGATGKKKRRP
jgi:hypothetical protein